MCASTLCAAIKASTGTTEVIFMLQEVKKNNKTLQKRQKEIRKVVKECGLDLRKEVVKERGGSN